MLTTTQLETAEALREWFFTNSRFFSLHDVANACGVSCRVFTNWVQYGQGFRATRDNYFAILDWAVRFGFQTTAREEVVFGVELTVDNETAQLTNVVKQFNDGRLARLIGKHIVENGLLTAAKPVVDRLNRKTVYHYQVTVLRPNETN